MKRTLALLLLVACWEPTVSLAQVDVESAGDGGYATVRPKGAKGPPEVMYATAAVKGPMPTNDWSSSLAWMPFSERQYPHPLAVQAEAGGLRIFYPGANITANKDAIFGFMPADSGDDLVLGHSGQPKFPDARVDGFSDWFVRAKFAEGERSMSVSYGHGCPFVFARFEGGRPQVTFAKAPEVWSGDEASAVLGVTIGGKHYGIFGPTGSKWAGIDGEKLTCDTDKDYCSIAILPKGDAETLALFARYAHSHVVNTRVTGDYHEDTALVSAFFSTTTEALEGTQEGTILALYPHQWKHTTAKTLDLEYASVRGPMKLMEGAFFETNYKFPGVLPVLPNVGGCDADAMKKMLQAEADEASHGVKDTYWDGKWLGKKAALIPIAEQYGEHEIARVLRDQVRLRLETWFIGINEKGRPKSEQLFWYDDRWGSLIGQPASFGSDMELNDHHFHYGYFIRAAAEVAARDLNWAGRWGPMVELLIRDVASTRHDDPLFPFLRNFDPYAGHSWASGHAKFGDGNNNESSSEAMNAWYGMILWGEYTGNHKIRDTGVILYTIEMNAIHEYWFDVHDKNHPSDYTPSVVTMVWGGKGANGTWFSGNPEVVHGINWLPIHGGSLYLGHYPEYVEKNYAALAVENKGHSWDEWADLIWMYRALSDPNDAMRQYNAGKDTAPKEGGNSLANTYHWIGTLRELGRVNPTVTADSPLAAVFDKGKLRTYVAFYQPVGDTVVYTDGFQFKIEEFGRVTAQRWLE